MLRTPQIILFVVVIFAALWGLQLLRGGSDSPEAKAYKDRLTPIASALAKAERSGDRATVIALMDPSTKIVEERNDLSGPEKEALNKTSLRYCAIAAVQLLNGVIEVHESGSWTSKSRYKNALAECK